MFLTNDPAASPKVSEIHFNSSNTKKDTSQAKIYSNWLQGYEGLLEAKNFCTSINAGRHEILKPIIIYQYNANSYYKTFKYFLLPFRFLQLMRD